MKKVCHAFIVSAQGLTKLSFYKNFLRKKFHPSVSTFMQRRNVFLCRLYFFSQRKGKSTVWERYKNEQRGNRKKFRGSCEEFPPSFSEISVVRQDCTLFLAKPKPVCHYDWDCVNFVIADGIFSGRAVNGEFCKLIKGFSRCYSHLRHCETVVNL